MIILGCCIFIKSGKFFYAFKSKISLCKDSIPDLLPKASFVALSVRNTDPWHLDTPVSQTLQVLSSPSFPSHQVQGPVVCLPSSLLAAFPPLLVPSEEFHSGISSLTVLLVSIKAGAWLWNRRGAAHSYSQSFETYKGKPREINKPNKITCTAISLPVPLPFFGNTWGTCTSWFLGLIVLIW